MGRIGFLVGVATSILPALAMGERNTLNLGGAWSVTLTAEVSSCADVHVGDTKERQWLVSWENHAYKIKVVGYDSNEASSYTTAWIREAREGWLVEFRNGNNIVMRINVASNDALTGKRYVARDCVVVYDISASRQH